MLLSKYASPRELALEFSTIKASSWRCSGLYRGPPQYSIVQKLFWRKSFLHSPASQSCLWQRFPPRERALGFGTIKASSWRCSGLRPGVSPVFDRTETILGEIFSPLARLPELSLGTLPPREHALGFGTIKGSSWRCSGLLRGVSPVFDRTETILEEIVSPLASLPELSLGALPPREHALGFGTIKGSSWRCSGLLRGVSPVFDRTETILGEIVPHSPGSQSCLWKRFPPESSLSGSVPPRRLLGAVAVLPRVSPVFDRTETILGEIVSPLARLPELSLGALPPREHALGLVPSRHLFGAIPTYRRRSLQYSIVQNG